MISTWGAKRLPVWEKIFGILARKWQNIHCYWQSMIDECCVMPCLFQMENSYWSWRVHERMRMDERHGLRCRGKLSGHRQHLPSPTTTAIATKMRAPHRWAVSYHWILCMCNLFQPKGLVIFTIALQLAQVACPIQDYLKFSSALLFWFTAVHVWVIVISHHNHNLGALRRERCALVLRRNTIPSHYLTRANCIYIAVENFTISG